MAPIISARDKQTMQVPTCTAESNQLMFHRQMDYDNFLPEAPAPAVTVSLSTVWQPQQQLYVNHGFATKINGASDTIANSCGSVSVASQQTTAVNDVITSVDNLALKADHQQPLEYTARATDDIRNSARNWCRNYICQY